MISHKHKCIIIHIPKNGGTSIEIFNIVRVLFEKDIEYFKYEF